MNCSSACDFAPVLQHGRTNFTCQQLSDYCDSYNQWTKTKQLATLGGYYSQVFAGAFGFICYILMLLTFRKKKFDRPSYIYHKSIVIMEFVHMAVMIQAGFTGSRSFDNTESYVVYRDILLRMWIFGDAMKLSVSVVTTFLSMERCIAIWIPSLFQRINVPHVAWSFVAISMLVACLHLSPAFCGYPVPKPGKPGEYTLEMNAYGKSGVNDVASETIYAIKVGSSAAIFVFCMLVAAGMVFKSKKAETMTTTAKGKWKSTRRLCVLQMVAAMSTLIDHITWVINKVIKRLGYQNDIVALEAVTLFSYNVAISNIEHQALYTWTWMGQTLAGELDHCGRFLLYLLCMKTFRDAFASLIKKTEHPVRELSVSNASRQNAGRGSVAASVGGRVSPTELQATNLSRRNSSRQNARRGTLVATVGGRVTPMTPAGGKVLVASPVPVDNQLSRVTA